MGRAGLILFAVFIVVPIAEIVLLAHVMGHIGILATIALIFATAIIGTFFIRQQGFGILTRATATMQKGGVAGLEIAEGGLLLFAGALLLTPGILTDAVGFLLLVPAVRQPVAKFTMNRLLRAGFVHMTTGATAASHGSGPGQSGPSRPSDAGGRSGAQTATRDSASDVIDADYEHVETRSSADRS